MTARVLVVDDVDRNVRLLEAKLSAEYYEVVTASSGAEALTAIRESQPDIVLLDVMMPDMDGFEVCQKIRETPAWMHLPVVMVTALSDIEDKVRGLQAGADDFLTKPVDDVSLFSRVRSLVRLKQITDELRLRLQTNSELGMGEEAPTLAAQSANDAAVLVVEESGLLGERLQEVLDGDGNHVTLVHSAPEAMLAVAETSFDLVLVCLEMVNDDPLRLCSQLRSNEASRHVPILIVTEEGDKERLAKAMDLGVTDYLTRPLEANELVARARTQIRRRRYQVSLREDYERSISMALTDHLTGCYNRRYLDTHLAGQIGHAVEAHKDLSVLVMDIDHFKQVNDTHGHAAGDEVLKEIAARVSGGLRNTDVLARFGGEEFVAVLPDADGRVALAIGERLRKRVCAEPCQAGGQSLEVAISIGAAAFGRGDTAQALLDRADAALYQAKAAGRNQVIVADRDGPASVVAAG